MRSIFQPPAYVHVRVELDPSSSVTPRDQMKAIHRAAAEAAGIKEGEQRSTALCTTNANKIDWMRYAHLCEEA